jgi:hypothetical protein
VSIIEISDFSENPSVSVFGAEKLVFSYKEILLLWKKESSKLNLSREKQKKILLRTAPYSQCQLKLMDAFSNTAKGRSYT